MNNEEEIKRAKKRYEDWVKSNWSKECWENEDDLENSMFFSLTEMLVAFEEGLTKRKIKLKNIK